MFDALKNWTQIQFLFLLIAISACKTNGYYEDHTTAPNVIMSSSDFSDIKPKYIQKKQEKFNTNYWIWKNNNKIIQIATLAANVGIYFTDENYNADKIINAFSNLKKKNVDDKSQIFNVYTNFGILKSVFFTLPEQTCFSTMSSFNDSGLHDWPGSRQKFFINYCEDGKAKLQLKNIKYFLQGIYVGQKGHEKLIIDGNPSDSSLYNGSINNKIKKQNSKKTRHTKGSVRQGKEIKTNNKDKEKYLYGAITYSASTGVFGYSNNQKNGKDAINNAEISCLRKGGGSECRSGVWFQNGCGALFASDDGWGTGYAPTSIRAKEYANDVCSKHSSFKCSLKEYHCTSNVAEISRGGVFWIDSKGGDIKTWIEQKDFNLNEEKISEKQEISEGKEFPFCVGSPYIFNQKRPTYFNKNMWCGKYLCPEQTKNWDRCVGDFTSQNGFRFVGLWRNGKSTNRGKLLNSSGEKVYDYSDYTDNNKGIYYINKAKSTDSISSNEISKIQKELKKIGIFQGNVDGKSGVETLKSINLWLQELGYPPVNYISKDIVGKINIHLVSNNPQKVLPPSSKRTAYLADMELRQRDFDIENLRQFKAKQVAEEIQARKAPPTSSGSTGSGFFVSKLGHIITNEHVVRQCGSVTVGDNANKQVSASVLETDKRNDLALLRISSTKMTSVETKSLISKLGLKLVPLASEGLFKSEDVELGEDVLVAGFPHGDFYSDGIKVTKGIVSGKKGMGDDRGQFQMDAAVQKGNSGGPIYDENGNIVGVVVYQLDPLKVAKAIGSLPQNVNFGIKASTVRQFLTSAGIPTKWSNRIQRKSFREVAQIAKNQTVMVVCNP